ncbi:hypothetical protein [Paenibacillus alba]|uniref:XRE family transcriptional regulator n=1 Tax=Paenibacillus alba TaxID=1197127 RepID=A0ABU6G257_9BACL|nr:hypothetical protein [Paenibacillus alba]MEC0227352.1 hypothetical protein [Paenibacillus alba]
MDNFMSVLKSVCEQKGKTSDEIFKYAKINSSNKNKILSGYYKNPNYRISREHAIALGLALKLNIEEMSKFLAEAGYALSRCHEFDRIVSNHIINQIYDIFTVEIALHEKGYRPLTTR